MQSDSVGIFRLPSSISEDVPRSEDHSSMRNHIKQFDVQPGSERGDANGLANIKLLNLVGGFKHLEK
jgi:hypothetical protein